MTPQTARAFDPEPGAITPVIVKSGGDTGGDDTHGSGIPNNVFIDSSSIPFAETVDGPTWVSSQSTQKGRIRHLKVTDGGLPVADFPIDPTSELASVSFKIGSAQLMAMESGVPAENNVLLLLISPEVPFRVIQNGDWTLSSTPFPDKIHSVTLMVGNQRHFQYDFQADNVEVRMHFK